MSVFNKYRQLTKRDQTIINGCRSGERSSQNLLYDQFAPVMLGVCLRYSRNRQEAEEVLQDGFMRVFTYIHKFRGDGSLEGWIRKIMIHVALDRYRRKIEPTLIFQLHPDQNLSGNFIEMGTQLSTKELLVIVQSLPPAYRMVFNLFVFEGFKHHEIAKAMGISIGTSKSNLYDARLILQKKIREKEKICLSSERI